MTESITVEQYREYVRTGRLPAAAASPAASPPPVKTAAHRFAGLARGRVATRGRMNATEAKWAAALERQRLDGLVRRWWFEPLRLRITDPAPGRRAVYFTADFLIDATDGRTLVDDVKGGAVNDASILRMKMAATIFDLWTFRIVQKVSRAAGEWEITEL